MKFFLIGFYIVRVVRIYLEVSLVVSDIGRFLVVVDLGRVVIVRKIVNIFCLLLYGFINY